MTVVDIEMVEHVCSGAMENGGRCPTPVNLNGEVCSVHLGRGLASEPETIQLNINVSANRGKIFQEAGIELRTRKSRKERSDEQAKAIRAQGGEQHPYRSEFSDSGTLVLGDLNASVQQAVDEMIEAGFCLQSLWLIAKENAQSFVLRATFWKGDCDFVVPEGAIEPWEQLRDSPYAGVYVYANIRDGESLHTVNMTSWQEKPPPLEIEFRGGLWGVRVS